MARTRFTSKKRKQPTAAASQPSSSTPTSSQISLPLKIPEHLTLEEISMFTHDYIQLKKRKIREDSSRAQTSVTRTQEGIPASRNTHIQRAGSVSISKNVQVHEEESVPMHSTTPSVHEQQSKSPHPALPEEIFERNNEEDSVPIHSAHSPIREQQSISSHSVHEEQLRSPQEDLLEEVFTAENVVEQTVEEPAPPRKRRQRIGKGKSTYPPATEALHGHLHFRNREHKQRYVFYQNCKIETAKSIHVATLEKLNFHDEFEELVANIGWQAYFALDLPSFTELTREFYATFKFDYKRKNFSISTPSTIHFRLMGCMHHYSIDDLNLALGLVTYESKLSHEYMNAYCDYHINDFDQTNAFRTLTGLEHKIFKPGHSKAYFLQSGALRYIHRFVAYSIFGCNNDSTTLSKCELFFLWCMVTKKKVNLGFWLASQFKRNISSRRAMSLGFVVTKIALHEKLISLNENDLHKACDMKPLDLACLDYMCLLRHEEGGFVSFVPAGQLAEESARVPRTAPAAATAPPPSTNATAAPSDLAARIQLLEQQQSAMQAELQRNSELLQRNNDLMQALLVRLGDSRTDPTSH